MTRGDSNELPEILFSQQTKKDYSRVIGFDLGSSSLTCSLSTDKIPATASVFQYRPNDSKNESHFPTCIQYKNWSLCNADGIKVGFEGLPQNSPFEEGDVYIPNIKKYVIQSIIEGTKEDGPDGKLVLSDFFTAVYVHFEKAFKILNEKQERAKAHRSSNNEQIAKRYDLHDCRFCFAIPDGLTQKLKYTNLIRVAFKEAGFLKENDDSNRLIFVNDAVAAGYDCLSAPRFFSGIELESNCLVADIGYDSAKFSVIKAQTTDATSIVVSSESSGIPGYWSLGDKFKNYLIDRSETFNLDITEPEQIDVVVDSFEKYQKVKIDLNNDEERTFFEGKNGPVDVCNADLREFVFKPFLDDLFLLIYKECQANDIGRIIFRGQYCDDPFFIQKCDDFVESLTFKRVPKCAIWEDRPKYMISNGAVSFGLRSSLTQIPTFISIKPLDIVKNSAQNAETQQISIEPQKTTSKPKGSFAVGIDFGTTFSGCSYADISTVGGPNNREIIAIEKWDKAEEYQKMSTVLRYNENSGKFLSWGFAASRAPKKAGDLNLEFFKLLLSPKNVDQFYGKGNRVIEENKKRFFMVSTKSNDEKKTKRIKTLTPVEIIAEYLKNFNTTIRKTLKTKYNLSSKDLRLEYVITVPAMWTEASRVIMLEAALKAELIKNPNEIVQLISEPEAAALSCEKFMKNTLKLTDDFFDNGLTFIVCDAGGGTVDLVTFTKKKENGIASIQQIGDGTGGTCGAGHLDKNFRELIQTFYTKVLGLTTPGEEFYKVHMDYFEKKIKHNFMPTNSNNKYRIQLPRFPIISRDTERKVVKNFKSRCHLTKENTVFEISENDIKNIVFGPIIEQVLQLLGTHIEKSSRYPPSAILLVGGFSQSKYLQQEIQRYCIERDIKHVCVPPNGVTAISRGAVSYYLEPRLVSKKSARVSYAIQVDNPEKANNKSHLSYFIRKGTPIDMEETMYPQTVSVEYPGSAVIALFSKDDEELPDIYDRMEPFQSSTERKLNKIVEYVIDLPENSSIANGTVIELEVTLKMAIDKISLDIQSRNSLIKLSKTGQVEKTGSITFKRIQMTPLKVNLDVEKVRDFNIFSIFSSKK